MAPEENRASRFRVSWVLVDELAVGEVGKFLNARLHVMQGDALALVDGD